MQREAVAHLTAMDMTMKCHHSSIKNLPLCLTTRLKEQRKKGLPCKPQRAGRSNVFSAGKAAFRFEGVTEALKAENQMLWVQRMNNIRSAAMEIVSSELIYC